MHAVCISAPDSCSMKFEHLPSANLVWHDLKLQHSSSDIVGIEEPFRLNVVCPLRISPSRIHSNDLKNFIITTGLLNHAKNIVYILFVHAGCKQVNSINRTAKKRRRIQCESNDLSDGSSGLASSEQSSNHEG